MENMHSIFEFGYIDNAPFPKNVNTDFFNPAPDTWHRFPIVRFKSALNGKQLKTRCFARIFREIPKIVQA